MTFKTGQALQLKQGFNTNYTVFARGRSFPLPEIVSIVGEKPLDGHGGGVTGDEYMTLNFAGLNFKMLSSMAREAYEPAPTH